MRTPFAWIEHQVVTRAVGLRQGQTLYVRFGAPWVFIGNAASYLLSDYASYVTGEAMVIDGGQWLSGADYWTRVQQMAPK